MLVCPTCAEDLADDSTACHACGATLPDWVTRLPLSTPPARSSIGGWLLAILGAVVLFVEVSGAMGWLAYLDSLRRH